MRALVGNLLHGENNAQPLWRRLVLTLTLLAFAQASFLTQTHLHPPVLPSSKATQGLSGHGKLPQRDDPAHCPLCQEYVVAGAYLSPAAIVLPLPELTTFAVLHVVRALAHVASASHNWLGRAPPLH
jgi:hypothetical protein